MVDNNFSLLSISVIIPVYKGGKAFSNCLASLSKSLLSPAEVIVVVDGDDSESYQVAEDFGAKVLQLKTNQGPARARNRGAEIAKGDILFFMDADVTIHPDTLEKIVTVFQNDPDLAALMGSYDDQPGASNFLSQYKNLFHHYNHQIGSEEASTFWGACGGIRRDIFGEMGGFDESYRRPCIEDIELGYRLKAKGYRIRLCKNIYVKHLKHWTPYSLLRADFFYRALPWTELIHRDRNFVNDLNLQLSSRLSVIFIYLLLITAVASFWFPTLLLFGGLLILGLIILNWPVYQFFLKKRGLLFTLQTLPWHWLYYFYSGLAFAIGTAKYRLKGDHPTLSRQA
ncbi:glycosyltransferase [Crocosphaera sp. UHCC 0190]|uniref:glycosyltransferase family 2 protein n=1 Tax=Crocosphaera sp. UHCC 0190 TaxID=3110246 RepID=UPI002B1E9A26|nr:glycosyltransferase [Crocosphaera sp. UHCC 0190]MEA5511029.1 glycosyltransferase [Crocosphaera sp. UHCC 0190]